MDKLIRAIFLKEGLPCRQIQRLSGGQVNQVFQVDLAYVLRIGAREDAFERLAQETALLRRLEGQIPGAKVLAFGEEAGQVYQIQTFVGGKMLIRVWKDLSPAQQEAVAADLAAAMQVIHSLEAPWFGYARSGAARSSVWSEYLAANFQQTLDELKALQIHMQPGIVELAEEYFQAHLAVLQAGQARIVHSDLTFLNLLVADGRLTAVLDFEYAMQAPPDYELWAIEAFCLYPNDWAEEGNEVYCSADFANLIPLLRKYYPVLFDVPDLRERVNLYQITAAFSSFLSWRKANLANIPPERMNGRDFYMARVTNFLFGHGARMF